MFVGLCVCEGGREGGRGREGERERERGGEQVRVGSIQMQHHQSRCVVCSDSYYTKMESLFVV